MINVHIQGNNHKQLYAEEWLKNRAKELETNQEPEVKQDPPQQPLVPVEAPPNVQEEDEDDMPLTALVPADPAAVSDAVVPSVSDAVVPYNPVVCTGSWYEELPASWEIRKIEKSLVNFHNQSSAGFLASPCAASSSILYLIDLVYLVGMCIAQIPGIPSILFILPSSSSCSSCLEFAQGSNVLPLYC